MKPCRPTVYLCSSFCVRPPPASDFRFDDAIRSCCLGCKTSVCQGYRHPVTSNHTGAPQGRVPSPFLFRLYSDTCQSLSHTTVYFKYFDTASPALFNDTDSMPIRTLSLISPTGAWSTCWGPGEMASPLTCILLSQKLNSLLSGQNELQ